MSGANIGDMRAMRLAERKAFDQETIDDYADMVTIAQFHNAVQANVDTLPNKQELLLDITKKAESLYDNSLTLEHLHDKVRMNTDPEQLQTFLNMLPVTVMRDMFVSANAELKRQKKNREDIVCLVVFALEYHLKTSKATLHLLERFKHLQDPEVEYVQAMVKDSQEVFLEKQAACKATGVLEEAKKAHEDEGNAS